MTTADEASKTAYTNRVEEVRQYILKVIEGLGAHIAKSGVRPDWGHVRDLQILCEMLKDVSDFIDGGGEA